ncbi:MAG: SDR family oxidoreductase [Pseudanabaenaceae cyanobacterium SKYGB_i_bin29]|nr:SDR family oxidoreductase [Pseudanabaenaceae cyanobacterium SKYG29]MDW8421398.1 SDR family oxidoreductase [Pseudanabaenaceae cyanobacterium SKYGB_i_bin29]
MRILVTGGAGFIGSHLLDRLLAEGHEVICLDNLYTGTRSNIAQWQEHPRFRFVKHDVIEPIDVEVEQIYHLACPASPVHYQADPIRTLKTSFLGTLHLLELAAKYNARLLLASTSEVYGDPLVHPQAEDYWGNVNCTGIRACYDEGKRVAETLAFDFQRQHRTDIRVARIFNTYGPRMLENDGRVVSNFICQALRGKDLTVYGDGSQTRSFCYVSDLVTGLIALMNSDCLLPVNLGNPGEYTILELAKTIKELVGNPIGITFQPLPQDDPQRRRPDITRAKTVLNWQPTIPLREGLEKTIADFRQRLS